MSFDPRSVPRLVPELPLPPYTFVPGGRWPHPVSDPRGHSFGRSSDRPPPVTATDWLQSRTYLHGIDLFNHGFFWEAHEAWEALWHAVGRHGPVADFLKGLIHLAAAGVKGGQGVPDGVRSHARRAAELFEQTARSASAASYLGLDLAALVRTGRAWQEYPPTVAAGIEPLRPGGPAGDASSCVSNR
jgi:hypothetical protein